MSKFSNRLRILRVRKRLTQEELASNLGMSKSTISMYENGKRQPVDLETLEQIADFFNVDLDYITGRSDIPSSITAVRIRVYGSIPAGIPIEAIEDVIGWEEISPEMIIGGREYFGLKVKGDSMSPKYQDGDIIIVQKQTYCESGEDCIVYVNDNDATLKKVVMTSECVILQPFNPNYTPQIYAYGDENNSVRVAGVVREIRRKV